VNPLNPPRPDLHPTTKAQSLEAIQSALRGATQNGKDMVLEDVIKLMTSLTTFPYDGNASGAIRQIQTALGDILLKHSPPETKS
jgi:hypothetical protein